MKQCTHHDRRAGIVTNQPDGYDKHQPHASRTVCDRQECHRAALAWVVNETGQHGTYVSDAERKARTA